MRGDEKRVGQILINLLGNAIKFTHEGEVVFRISYSCGVTTFQVIDTGPGIDQDQLQNIFQPFTQLASENLVSGSGLGLTISKVLAEIMGGELIVSSSPGKGSSFTVRLYLANLGGDSEKAPQNAIIGYHGNIRNILVVDDQFEHRLLIRSILEPFGFNLDEAGTGAECLSKLNENKPDLILLDLSLPEIDGLETAQRIRHQGHSIPIVMLTSNAYPSDRVNAIHAGCNDFLAKPLQIEKLLNKLKIQLGLRWVFQREELTVPEKKPPRTQEYLPLGIHEEINGYVRIGDLLGLNQYLHHLENNNPQFQEFAHRLLLLSKEFRIAEIKKIMNLTVEKNNDYVQKSL